MKYLQIYENFITNPQEDTLYIFDFDDTLVKSPRFEELVMQHLKEDVSVKSLLDKSLNHINKTRNDLKMDNGRIYVDDIDKKIPLSGNWVRKKGRVYLIAPDKFYYTDLSLPTSTNKISELYNSVKNKAIVTGRVIDMEEKVKSVMNILNLELPNFGVYCYPHKGLNSDKVPVWKGKTIVNIIRETGFRKAMFFDDKTKWLNTVNDIVKSEMPDIKFDIVKV